MLNQKHKGFFPRERLLNCIPKSDGLKNFAKMKNSSIVSFLSGDIITFTIIEHKFTRKSLVTFCYLWMKKNVEYLCVWHIIVARKKILYSITANMLYPNPTLTLWETPAMIAQVQAVTWIAALPPLDLFFSISIFLLFFSSLLPSLSSRLLLSSQVRHWRIATLSPLPTYLLTYLRSPSTKYQVQTPLIPGAYEHWFAPYTWKHATTITTCPTPGWANQCPTYTRYIGRGLDLVPRLWALEGERL